MSFSRRCAALLITSSLTVSAAQADLPWAWITRDVVYLQTSSTQLDFYYGRQDALVQSSTPGTFTSAKFVFPDGSSQPLDDHDPLFYNLPENVYSPAAMEANYPSGAYRVIGYNGTTVVHEFPLAATPTFSATTLPRVTNYAAVANAVAGQSLTIDVQGFTPVTTGAQSFYYYLYEYVGGHFVSNVAQGSLAPTAGGSITVDAGRLVEGHDYELELAATSASYLPNNGNGGTFFSEGSTYVRFRPVPEPATFAALGLGTLGLLRRRRRVI